MSADTATPPAVVWAQRPAAILLTICLEDCKSPDIKINPDSLEFSGVGGPDKKLHKLKINFYSEVDPEKSLHAARDRNIEFILRKKEEGPFWPHLTKEKVKHHWLKVDFEKWRDSEDSEDEGLGGGPDFGGSDDLEEMMKQMGGLRAAEGGKPSMDDMNETDSDDSDLPDLE